MERKVTVSEVAGALGKLLRKSVEDLEPINVGTVKVALAKTIQERIDAFADELVELRKKEVPLPGDKDSALYTARRTVQLADQARTNPEGATQAALDYGSAKAKEAAASTPKETVIPPKAPLERPVFPGAPEPRAVAIPTATVGTTVPEATSAATVPVAPPVKPSPYLRHNQSPVLDPAMKERLKLLPRKEKKAQKKALGIQKGEDFIDTSKENDREKRIVQNNAPGAVLPPEKPKVIDSEGSGGDPVEGKKLAKNLLPEMASQAPKPAATPKATPKAATAPPKPAGVPATPKPPAAPGSAGPSFGKAELTPRLKTRNDAINAMSADRKAGRLSIPKVPPKITSAEQQKRAAGYEEFTPPGRFN